MLWETRVFPLAVGAEREVCGVVSGPVAFGIHAVRVAREKEGRRERERMSENAFRKGGK